MSSSTRSNVAVAAVPAIAWTAWRASPLRSARWPWTCDGNSYEAAVTARITGRRCRIEVVLCSFIKYSPVLKLLTARKYPGEVLPLRDGGLRQNGWDDSDNG